MNSFKNNFHNLMVDLKRPALIFLLLVLFLGSLALLASGHYIFGVVLFLISVFVLIATYDI